MDFKKNENIFSLNTFMKRIFMMIIVMVLTISVVHAYSFQVLSTNPAPIEGGDYADITLRIDFPLIDGDSEQIDPVTFYIKETDEIKPVSGQEFNLLSARSGQSVTTTFRVFFSESIPTGNIPLTLVAQEGIKKIELEDDIFVQAAPRGVDFQIAQVQSTPQTLLQDTKSNELRVTLQNLGEKNAEMIVAKLGVGEELVDESFFYSMQDSISQINGGEQAELEFTIDIEETMQTQIPMILDISYRVKNSFDNSYTNKDVSIPVEIRLTESPRFEIVSVEPRGTLQAGTSSNEVVVRVENVGLEEAEDARLRMFPDPSIPFDFEVTSHFISSSIKPGEQASVVVPFDIMDEALVQTYTINTDFESLVGANRFTQSERLEIEVEEESTDGAGTYLIVLLVITIGGAIIIGYFYNSSSKKNKGNKGNREKSQ